MPPPEPQRPKLLRLLPALELGALLLVALWALIFQLRLPGRLPDASDYEQVRAHLTQHAREGDVLLLHPWWTERARLFAPAGLPVVGYLGSERDPLTRHPRIWVLSQPDLPGADRAGFDALFLPSRTPEGDALRFGRLELRPYQNGRHRPVAFALSEVLQSAEVYVEGADGSRTPCRAVPGGFRCPNNQRVAVEWHELKAEPRRCVWAPPPGRDRRLVIALPSLPAAAGWSLEAGYTWDRGFHHGPTLTPTTLRVETADGRAPIDLTLPVGLEGVQRATAEQLGEGPIRLTVSSANPELRDVCLDLFGYGGAP